MPAQDWVRFEKEMLIEIRLASALARLFRIHVDITLFLLPTGREMLLSNLSASDGKVGDLKVFPLAFSGTL